MVTDGIIAYWHWLTHSFTLISIASNNSFFVAHLFPFPKIPKPNLDATYVERSMWVCGAWDLSKSMRHGTPREGRDNIWQDPGSSSGHRKHFYVNYFLKEKRNHGLIPALFCCHNTTIIQNKTGLINIDIVWLCPSDTPNFQTCFYRRTAHYNWYW